MSEALAVLDGVGAFGQLGDIPLAPHVVVGHKAVLAGGIINFLGRFRHVLPGPVVGGIGNSGGVEHLLVVDQDHVVLVLGDAVHPAVAAAGVADGDLGEMVLVVAGVLIGIESVRSARMPKSA